MKQTKASIIILFIIILLIIVVFKEKTIKETNGMIVLAYHHILSKEEKDLYQKDNNYTITDEEFEEQLIFLKKHNYNPINSAELKCWLEDLCDLPNNSVLITIDDGNVSTYKYALPLLEKYQYNAIAFIITSRVKDITDKWDPSKLQFMGVDLIDDIKNNHPLLEIGSHSYDMHKTIENINPKDYCSKEEITEDITIAKEALNTNLFCYPFGQYNEKYIEALKASGHEMAFTFKPFRKVSKDDGVFEIPRINVNAGIGIKRFEANLK